MPQWEGAERGHFFSWAWMKRKDLLKLQNRKLVTTRDTYLVYLVK